MYLPGQSTLEMSFESAQFDADLFAMANQQTFHESTTYVMPVTEILTAASGGVFTLSETPVAGSVSIPNCVLEANKDGDADTRPTYTVSGTSVTCDQFEAGDEVEISYEVVKTVNTIEITNKTSAVGELVAKFPVYATGDEEDSAGVKGYVILKIYKCRATAMPGFLYN